MAPLEPYRGISAEVRRFDGTYAGRLLLNADYVVNFRSDDRDGVVAAYHAAVEAYLHDPERYRVPKAVPSPPERPHGPVELRYDTWGHGNSR